MNVSGLLLVVLVLFSWIGTIWFHRPHPRTDSRALYAGFIRVCAMLFLAFPAVAGDYGVSAILLLPTLAMSEVMIQRSRWCPSCGRIEGWSVSMSPSCKWCGNRTSSLREVDANGSQKLR